MLRRPFISNAGRVGRAFALTALMSTMTSTALAESLVPYAERQQVDLSVLPTASTYPTTILPGCIPVILVMPFAGLGSDPAWWADMDNVGFVPIIHPHRLMAMNLSHPIRTPKAAVALYQVGAMCSGSGRGLVCTVQYY